MKGVRVNHRGAGDHVGEISAADPSQPRSADIVVVEDGVALRVPEGRIHELAKTKPEIRRCLLVEANKRLVQRNALVRSANEQPVVFIVSSVEALETARSILVEPRDGHVKLASDLRGLTTLSYRATGPGSIDSRIGPTVTEIRRHIAEIGVRC